jgi:hypothetical protein
MEKVVVNGMTISDPKIIAESVSNFFAGVPEKIVQDIPTIPPLPPPPKVFY